MTPPSWSEMVAAFGRIGLLSFGGPAAQIGLMHRVLVDERRWLDEARFMDGLGFCMLLPGPEAMQLATYCGWRLRGVPGGLVAGGLFVLPGAVLIAALALAYAGLASEPATAALLLGVKAAVVAIVFDALRKLGKRGLGTRALRWTALLAFVAIFAFGLPFPLIVAAAALAGYLSTPRGSAPPAPPLPRPRLAVWAGWATLWLAPLPVLWAMGQTLLFQLSAFFAKLALVSFGGAYAVLAYMTQEVVETRGWLETSQMVDALGLAETTPGPLILVTQFVGMQTGMAAGGTGLALWAGVLTLWMTFIPCFLWIFAGAPYIDALRDRPRLSGALAAVTAAVFGVILNLSIWFALHVLFAAVGRAGIGPLSLPLPDPVSLNPQALALVVLAFALLLGLRRGMVTTIALCAAAGLGLWALLP